MPSKDFYHYIQKYYAGLSATDRHIADYIQQNANEIIKKRVADVAEELKVAPSTIINFCKQIGYKGYTELRLSIAENLSTHLDRIMDDVKIDDKMPEIIDKVFRTNINALRDTLKYLDGAQVAQALEVIRDAKKVLVFGIGPSALVAQDAYNRFLRIGIPVQYAGDPLIMRLEAKTLDDKCVAMAVSYAGRTEDTVNTAKSAKEAGAKLICLSSFDSTPLAEMSDIRLIAYTHETKVFREATASRLAQLAIIDALYTGIALADYDHTRVKLDEEEMIYREIRI